MATYEIELLDRNGYEFTAICVPDVVMPLFWGDASKRAFDLMHSMYELGVNDQAYNGYGYSAKFEELAKQAAGYLGGMFLV